MLQGEETLKELASRIEIIERELEIMHGLVKLAITEYRNAVATEKILREGKDDRESKSTR